MSSTPVVPTAETPQQKLAREVAEFSARKIADAKFEQEQARLKAEQDAYAASPEGQREHSFKVTRIFLRLRKTLRRLQIGWLQISFRRMRRIFPKRMNLFGRTAS
jgi:hypothetical protein